MRYKPHQISVRKFSEPVRDALGRATQSSNEVWETAEECRCDESNVEELTDENGSVYRPKYHVVVEGSTTVNNGDEVRCLRKTDNSVRGSGIAHNVKHLNYLPFSEFYL